MSTVTVQVVPTYTKEQENAALTKVKKAITTLIIFSSNSPVRTYYASLVLGLDLKVGDFLDGVYIPTAATNGKCMIFNPLYVLGLTDEQVIGLLAHEIEHCARLHMLRREARNISLWNVATDLHINRDLDSEGFKLPQGGLRDDNLLKRTEEETYYYLPKEMGEDGNGEGEGNGDGQGDGKQGKGGKRVKLGIGGVLDAPKDSNGNTDENLENEWRERVEKAAMIAKAAGSLPGYVEGYIKEARKPKVRWQDELRDCITSALIVTDQTYARPARRFLPHGLYLPSALKEGQGVIVACLDTSGSVGEEAHKQFAGELRSIHEELKPARLIFVYVDTVIQRVLEFGPDDDVVTPYVGGGGTYFNPGLKWPEANDVQPDCLIYLTDMYPADTPEDPGFPVIWASVTDDVAPWFGRKIFIDLSK